jgi:hypothetical protein
MFIHYNKKLMSDSNSSFEFIYENDEGKPYPCLNFTYKDDGTALLTNPICKNCEVILDQSVVKYLKHIQEKINGYRFELIGRIWYINSLPTPDKKPDNQLGFVSGDMIDDGKKIICTNPKPNPILLHHSTD